MLKNHCWLSLLNWRPDMFCSVIRLQLKTVLISYFWDWCVSLLCSKPNLISCLSCLCKDSVHVMTGFEWFIEEISDSAKCLDQFLNASIFRKLTSATGSVCVCSDTLLSSLTNKQMAVTCRWSTEVPLVFFFPVSHAAMQGDNTVAHRENVL